MRSTAHLLTELKVDSESGSGACPVCHRPREVNGCTTWWRTRLNDSLSGRKGWSGTLFVTCHTFPADRDELQERLNVYHQRSEP